MVPRRRAIGARCILRRTTRSCSIQLTLGFALLGEAALAAELGERALALHPLCPSWYFYYASIPHFVLRDYARSVELGLKTPIIVTDGPAYLAADLRVSRQPGTRALLPR